MNHARAIFGAVSLGALASCHVHSSASASFSFDASFGPDADAGAITAPATTTDAAAGANAASGPSDAGANLTGDDGGIPDDFAVRFERTACLGTCPMYVVHVGAHGAVRFSSRLYVGDRFVDGCASKNIGDRGVADLRAALAKYGYFSLKKAYSGGPTDAPSINMSVTANHKTKIVSHYTAAPILAGDRIRLDGVEDAIDQISGAADFASKGGALTPCTFTGN